MGDVLAEGGEAQVDQAHPVALPFVAASHGRRGPPGAREGGESQAALAAQQLRGWGPPAAPGGGGVRGERRQSPAVHRREATAAERGRKLRGWGEVGGERKSESRGMQIGGEESGVKCKEKCRGVWGKCG